MKNIVKSLLALMVIVFAVACNAKTEKAAEGDTTTVVPHDSTEIDSAHVVTVDTVKQDSTGAH